MESPADNRGRARELAERWWIGPGLVVAAVLLLVRTRVIADLAVLGRGVDPAIARWAAAMRMGSSALTAIVLALSATAILHSVRGSPGMQRFVALFVAILCFAAALSGWPVDGELDPALFTSELRLASFAVLATVALVLALGLWAALQLAESRTARPRSWAILVGILAIAPLAQHLRARFDPPRLRIREVVADLTLDRHILQEIVRKEL